MMRAAADTHNHCSYCGHPITDEPTMPERFGERFCSEAHAGEFAAAVRATRMEAAAQREMTGAPGGARGGEACALPPPGQRGWRDYLRRGACWGAPLLLLVAVPLLWSGGWAAAGGSLLSLLALLSCPVGMYFMMRGMMSMQHQDRATAAGRDKEDRRA